jgi:hypothetical protein
VPLAVGQGETHLFCLHLVAGARLTEPPTTHDAGPALRSGVVAVDFEKSIVWIKWSGTHAEYDNIDVKTVSYEKPNTPAK